MEVKKYKLMIKTHSVTNLKYLCITSRDDWKQYAGSGVRWRKHLDKHGSTFTTELLYTSDEYDDFLEQCLYYSTYYNVVLSEEFANLVPETGYNNNTGMNNLVLWWQYASEELKQATRAKRKPGQIQNHWKNGPSCATISEKLSIASKNHWAALTLDERRARMQPLYAGSQKFFLERDDKYNQWHKKVADALRLRTANTPFAVLSARSSKQRLELSDEKKLIRKEKIQAVYATGKHDRLFDRYSNERRGIGNPAAKLVIWQGRTYTKQQFADLKIDKDYAKSQFNTNPDCKWHEETKIVYETISCPHCKKSTSNKPSAFKRWHFNNCKEKI